MRKIIAIVYIQGLRIFNISVAENLKSIGLKDFVRIVHRITLSGEMHNTNDNTYYAKNWVCDVLLDDRRYACCGKIYGVYFFLSGWVDLEIYSTSFVYMCQLSIF